MFKFCLLVHHQGLPSSRFGHHNPTTTVTPQNLYFASASHTPSLLCEKSHRIIHLRHSRSQESWPHSSLHGCLGPRFEWSFTGLAKKFVQVFRYFVQKNLNEILADPICYICYSRRECHKTRPHCPGSYGRVMILILRVSGC